MDQKSGYQPSHGYRQKNTRRLHYQVIRERAYELTIQVLRQQQILSQNVLNDLRIRDIDDAALDAVECWPNDDRLTLQGRGQWSWRRESARFNQRSSSLCMAVWCEGMLCALVAGKLSRRKMSLRVHLVQGMPADHPLRGQVANVMVLTTMNYAAALNCSELTIESPYPEVRRVYETFGFIWCDQHGKQQKRMVMSLEN